MVGHLGGVADDADSEAVALRYYVQSHLIHRFMEFMKHTPAQFVARPQPTMTLTLEVRQARQHLDWCDGICGRLLGPATGYRR